MGGTSQYSWKEGSFSISVPPGKTVYLISEVGENSITISAIDPDTWTSIGSLSDNIASSKGIRRSNGANLRQFKETSIGQHTQNFQSGSYFFDAHWYSTYVYSDSGYGLLDNNRTYCKHQYPAEPTPKVDVVQTQQWYEDYVDIDLR